MSSPPVRRADKLMPDAKLDELLSTGATLGRTAVQRPTPNHLYWPQLDVDLAVESIRDPAAFPLVSSTAA